ncbi:hypothetical protein ABE42_36850 [Bacillus thuringiensis]|nr:hypothetical protein [Bacillus thuringiensis]
MKKFVAIVTGILLTAGLTACGDTEVKEVKKDSSAKQEQKKEESNKVFAIGDTFEVNGLQLTFTSANFVEPNEYTAPEKGKVLEIQFSAKNNGKKEMYFGAEELKLADGAGNQFKEYFGMDNSFMNENIAAGNQITGKMYYDVAEADKYTGTYKPSFTLDEKSVKMDFQVK